MFPMNNFVLATVIIICLHPQASFAILDSSEIEASFGCSELTVLAEEINRREERQFGLSFCPTYNDIASALDFVQGDIDEIFLESGFADSGLPSTDQIIAQRETSCKSLASSQLTQLLGGNPAVWEESIDELDFLPCPQTYYACEIDTSLISNPNGSTNRVILQALRTAANVLKFKTVDHNCVREAIKTVTDFQESFNQHTAVSNACRQKTVSLEQNDEVDAAFSAIELKTRTRVENDRTTEVFSNLDKAKTFAYEETCISNGGTFVEINLTGTCNGWNTTSSSPLAEFEIDVIVANRPRCYGIDCTSRDVDGLFEYFTLRETEERQEREMPGTFWACQGQLVDNAADLDICTEETAMMDEVDLLGPSNDAIVPEFEQKQGKFLFFITIDLKGEQDATFVNSTVETAAYEEACVDLGGEFSIANDFVVECEKKRVGGTRLLERLQFDVSGFPVCLSSSCNGSDDRDGAEAELMLEKLKRVGALGGDTDFEWTCSHTSGASRLLLAAPAFIFAAMAALWIL